MLQCRYLAGAECTGRGIFQPLPIDSMSPEEESTLSIRRRLATAAVAVLAGVSTAIVVVPATPAQAHGVTMIPGSRTWFCFQDGLRPNGEIIAFNPACAAAIAQSGTTPLYNWFANLRSDGAGRTVGFIPDGQICSGGNAGPFDFSPYNAVRSDWPVTHLTSPSTIQFRHSNWAAHPGAFVVYVTRQGWNPNGPLRWADLESVGGAQDPPQSGGPGALNYYFWQQQLPAGRSGRHIIFTHWIRSDSQENFYSCSDVVFDGGNGEVTGICPGCNGGPGPSASPSRSASPNPSRSASASPNPSRSSSPAPSGQPGTCSATYTIVNSWPGGFQADLAVRNNGTTTLNGWTARFTFANGQTLTQMWNGTYTATGSLITVKPAAWTTSIPAGGSVSVGFLANSSSASNTVTNLACTSP